MQKKSTKKSAKSIPKSVESISPESIKATSPEYVPLYRKIALTFLSLSLVLSLGILYLSTAKAEIIIFPKPEIIKNKFNVTLRQAQGLKENLGENCLLGQIFTTTVEGKEIFPATQVEFKDKKARGTVTIINNYSRPQTLIRTTRLLSTQGILFRTDKTIQVPAGSQMQVQVYADQPGIEGEIEPSHFTIPGLWPGIQDKIYGESKEAMTEGLEEIKIVSQDDIQQAKEMIEKKLTEKALEESGIRNQESGIRNYEIQDFSVSAKPGDQKDEFEITMKLKLITFIFDEKEMLALIEEKLKDLIAKNTQLLPLAPLSLRGVPTLVGTTKQSPDYKLVLNSYNLEEKTAVLSVFSQGKAIITPDNPLLAKEVLIGKNKQEVKAYLEKYPEIESVQVEFSPFWVRSVPFLKNRIEIIIQASGV
jgi:hypothetical protein